MSNRNLLNVYKLNFASIGHATVLIRLLSSAYGSYEIVHREGCMAWHSDFMLP